ncbi:DNA-binding response OmpR family regulator [Spirosoma lacussanchae]|uniref:response regulator n=1 Tax=Spirosoma lacussanchae TaxID=1884249 RepID=UPI00110864B8|nr:response regulator [Spirosoma lacussanchae]
MHSSLSDASRRNLHRASLIIIEDNPDERVIIRRAAEQTLEDISLIWANTADDALRYLDQCDGQVRLLPKLVLLDLYLPDAEQGWQFLTQLKDRSWKRSLPIVVLSRSSSPADVIQAYDLGANSYIIKPGSLEAWHDYFSSLRLYWWETVTLPVVSPAPTL